MSVSPAPKHSYVEILTPQGDSGSRRDLGETVRSRVWGPNKWASALIKKTPESSLPLYPVRTMAQGCLTCPPAHTELLLWLEVRKEMVPRYAGGCLPVLLPQNALESGL